MPLRKIKSFLFNFFHFNNQEQNGIFVLCCIIILLFSIRLFLPMMMSDSSQVQLITLPLENSENSAEQNITNNIEKEKTSNGQQFSSSEYFVFNPNTISKEDAQKLGFSKKLSSVLINFRKKGGKFFKATDLKKLYGLSPTLYDELEPYILIPNTKHEFKHDSFTWKNNYHTNTYPERKTFIKTLVDINTADSLSIVYLKGIGPGFTKRIIKYRTMLGGFHTAEQLKQVYGMTDSIFINLINQVKIDKNTITKIPINAIDFNSLRKHPYFSFQSAQAIINYRSKHGKLTEVDLISLGIFTEEKLKLILPYLTY